MSAQDTIDKVLRPLVREAMKHPTPAEPAITVETANVDNRQMAAPPPQIPMPDHEIRSARWYQLFVRLARPTLDWVGVMGAAWSQFLGDWLGHPMSGADRIIVLGFVCTLFGIRTFEKIKGVA